ncbi:fibronectin type III domain-containing protein [Longitalea arenae]|uniref:fibronectin type III domain-containing protein n=1 Tax=Longitalea arenae TaxID=2812558 RepID=UPI001967A2E5|nr:fibronectin type III domain-containing protein [Longitalea arenae]
MARIVAKFKKRQNDLMTIGQRVIEKMENNTVFPNPPAALAELKKLLPEFQAALSNAEGRDKEMVSIKNDKKAIILALLQELADYVTATSKGDRTLIFNSGFDATNESRGSTLPPSIDKLEVELGPSGEATIRAKSVTGAKSYAHQYTTEPPGLNTIWSSEFSSESVYTFKDLSSDKRYWFRVVAIGFNRQTANSPVVSRVIQ